MEMLILLSINSMYVFHKLLNKAFKTEFILLSI